MTDHTPEPVTENEAAYLHSLGWQSGHGWENLLDWFREPSSGPVIFITEDPAYMAQWLEDREVYRQALHGPL